MDQYGSPSFMTYKIMRLKASIFEGEKCFKNAYEDVVEACHAFKVDQNVL